MKSLKTKLKVELDDFDGVVMKNKQKNKSSKSSVFDIIVVGAGMAGLSTAVRLSNEKNKKLKILLIEKIKLKEIGYNHFIGTFNDLVDKYEFQKAVVNKFKSFRFYGPKEKADIKFDNGQGMSYINLNKFSQVMLKKINIQIKTETEIVNAKYSSKGITLISKDKKKYNARIVIDCSGNTSVVADSLGIERSKVYCKTLSYTLTNVKIPKKFRDRPMMFQDYSITRSAGAWITPYGNKVHVGISSLNPYYQSTKGDLQRRLDWFLMDACGYSKYLKNAKVKFPKLYKISPTLQPIDPMVKDNLIVVGDAAGQATPFFGLGSDPCLKMGEIAAEVALDSLEKGDYSQKNLIKYEKIWWKIFGRYDLVNILLRKICANYFKDDEWDGVIKSLKKITSNDFYKALRSEYSLKLVFKIFPSNMFFKIIFRIIKVNFLSLLHPKLSPRHLAFKIK